MECYNEQLFTDDEEWAEPFSFNFDKILIDVPEEDSDKYDGHDKRLDIENPRKFGQFEFIKACLEMGVIQGEELNRFKAMTE